MSRLPIRPFETVAIRLGWHRTRDRRRAIKPVCDRCLKTAFQTPPRSTRRAAMARTNRGIRRLWGRAWIVLLAPVRFLGAANLGTMPPTLNQHKIHPIRRWWSNIARAAARRIARLPVTAAGIDIQTEEIGPIASKDMLKMPIATAIIAAPRPPWQVTARNRLRSWPIRHPRQRPFYKRPTGGGIVIRRRMRDYRRLRALQTAKEPASPAQNNSKAHKHRKLQFKNLPLGKSRSANRRCSKSRFATRVRSRLRRWKSATRCPGERNCWAQRPVHRKARTAKSSGP